VESYKRPRLLLSHFDLAKKHDHFAKTGWGQTQGKAGKRGAFLQASRAEEKRLTDVVAHMEAEAISAYRVGCENVLPFGAIFVATRTQSICQDRLGTNTREYTPKRHIFLAGPGARAAGAFGRDGEARIRCETNAFLGAFHLDMTVLPRQARDKRKETLKNGGVFRRREVPRDGGAAG
jgi:hypothetical protein